MSQTLASQIGLGEEQPHVQNEQPFPQHHFRMIINGGSGCGKTNIIFENLLKGEIKYDKLYIYARNLYECKYEFLIKHHAKMAEEMGLGLEDLIEVGDRPEDIIAVDQLDKSKMNVVIFDDWIADKKVMNTIIRDHWIRGRKHSASYIFISQDYFNIPKEIRGNSDYFILFKNLPRQQRQINVDMADVIDPDIFKQLYKDATKKRFTWMLVDKKTMEDHMRFRKGYDGFLEIEEDSDSE